MKSLQKNRILFTLITGLILFFFFVGLEIVLIAFGSRIFENFVEYDPDLGFRVRPYSRNSNRFGFNDRDYPLDKDDNTFRLLILGDSFNWAGERQNNYTAILEKMFEKQYGAHRVDVINTGYPGTNTAQELAALTKYGLQYNPDFVFLGFFAGNDFLEANPYKKRIIVCGTYINIDKRNERTILGHQILRYPRLWYIIRGNYLRIREQIHRNLEWIYYKFVPGTQRQGGLSKRRFLAIERVRLEFCNIKKHIDGIYDTKIEYTFQSILKMRDLLKSKNIGFMVVIYPDEFQVNDVLREQVFKVFDLKEEDYNIYLMQDILKKFLAAQKIPYIDLLAEFRAKEKETSLYEYRDTHWNEEGNRITAEILFRTLRKIVRNSLARNNSPGS